MLPEQINIFQHDVDEIFAHKMTQNHKSGALYKTFPPAEARRILQRLEFHYTSKHGSWLNRAEIEIAILERDALSRRLTSEAALRHQVLAVEAKRNEQRRGIA